MRFLQEDLKMQTKKNKFLLALMMALVLVWMVAPAQAATWDTTMVYYATSVTKYDVAVGDKLKGASDDTVRILTTQAGSPYGVLLATDRSTALPMSWVTETVWTNTVAMRGCAIGDVDGDGQNEIIVGNTSSPYGLKMIKWNGSAWVATTVLTSTSSYVGACYDIAIGDADNNPATPNDIVFNNSSYGVMKARWNGATFDTTRILYNTGNSTYYGVAIGDFDQTYAGNEIVVVSYGQRVYRIKFNGATWDTATIFYTATDYDYYDVAVGNFDASNPGDEIAINNGYNYASGGAVQEVYGSGSTWTMRNLGYNPSNWSSYGEIAVGDFYTSNPGAEIVAVSGGGSAYEARLVYGSGTTWYNEKIMGTGGSTYGVAIGNLNRYRPGNEIAVGGNYRVWEAEQKLLNYDMAAISIDDVAAQLDAGATVTIKTTVKNFAEYDANAPVPVKMSITGPGGYSYTDVDQATSTNLPPAGTEQITFSPDWTVPATLGTYTIKAWTELAGDEVPANDTVTILVTVIRSGGLVESFTGTTFPPPGWTVYNFFTTADDAWSRYTAYYHSAPACARIYYDLPNNDWLITPRLKVVSGDNLTFWWRTQSTSYQESLWVRVSTNPDVSDTGAYTIVDVMTSTGDISWFQREVDLSSYAGQDVYIAFWYRCYNNYGVAIDDVTGPYFPPQIQVAPDSIYVESFPDSFFDVFFYIDNIGGGILNYTNSLAASSSWLTVHPTSGSLSGGEQDEDTLSFNTTGMDGHYYDTLVIASNSGEKATNLIPIHIWVRLIPDISVSPDSFAVGVDGNGTKDTAMFIDNSGNGELNYTVETEEWSKFGVVWDGVPAVGDHRLEMTETEREALNTKGGLDPRRGTTPAKGMGGPDAFGYRWIDSDEAGGPIFNWIEINGIGTSVDVTDDGNVGPFNIGFPFDFYGNTFTDFRIAGNGFVSFTSTSGTLTNATIPDAAEPNNLLALMWDDLRTGYGGGAGNVYYHSNSNRLVIEYDHVIRYGQTNCPYTMEIILYPNGKIIYQYLQMGDGTCTYLNQSTIGIENGTGTDGLEVVFNADYVHDNLAIRFSSAPAWLVFAPESGTIPPSETDTIDITFDATGILSGDFYGAFLVSSNDPDTPVDTVPAHMTILVPDMTFDPAAIDTVGTEGGAPFDVTLDIGNAGAAKLMFNIVESVPWLSVSPVADTVDVGEGPTAVTLTINCTNLYAGSYVGTVKVYSNDPDFQPYASYLVSLKVGPEPDIAVNPEEFYIGIYAGYTKDTSMTISNTGDGHLVWGTAIEELGKGADTTLYEGFEGTFPPADWTVVNNDGGTVTWEQTTTYYHTGTHSASCRWESTTLWNDDWLITPRISIGSNDSLSFWYRAYSTTWPESLEVRLSTTTNDVSAFTTLLWAGSQLVNTTFEQKKIELGKYSRGQVYIAFVYKGLDEFRIYIDDVCVQSYAGPWLVVDPLSGITNPHSNTGVSLNFSSVGYETDMYANLWITSNDPDESPVLVPVHMAILGPSYSVSPPETLVIDALEGQYTDGHVFVQNYGGHAPLAYKMTDSVAWLSESPDTADVPIDGEQDVTVTVDGNQLIAGDYATQLFIKTNDFDTPMDTLVVIVHMGPPPDIRVEPDSFRVQVLAGSTKDTTMTVYNDGDGHLAFELSTEETGLKLAGGKGLTDFYEALGIKQQDIPKSSSMNPRPVDTSNPAELTVLKSEGPSIMLAPGSPLMTTADGETVFIQLPHDPGDTWSFGTSDQGAGYKLDENFWGVTLPMSDIHWWGLCLKYVSGAWQAGDPNNLVFDITFYSDPPDDPTLPPDQVACTYLDVSPTVVPTGIYFTTSAGTFEMYFFTGVELDPICNLPEGWVSIQSKSAGQGYDWFLWASAKTGDGFSYQENGTNPRYYDQALILTGGQPWFTVAPEADTVDPLSSTNVTVTFDATQIMGGEKFGNIIIESNDPDESPYLVPVHMIVGGAQYAITPESLHIEALENQYTNASLTVSNPSGEGPLSYKMTDPVAWLTENPDTADILPDAQQVVTVRVDGYQLIAGNYLTYIAVKTNAVNQQYDTIPVSVHVGPDAKVDINPMSLNVGICPGFNKVEKLKIDNLGGGHLGFVTEVTSGPKGFFMSSGNAHPKLPPADARVAKDGTPVSSAPIPSLAPPEHGFSAKDVLLAEGFEDGWLPAGWSIIQTSTDNSASIPGWWSQTSYSVHSGTYAAGLWWSYYHQDEWLITPEIAIAGACTLSFWTYGWEGSTYGDHYYVKVSTDGGSTWTVVFDLSTLTLGDWNMWAYPYYIDLSAYSGQNVKIAWHAEDPPSNDGLWYIWIIDDITLTCTGGGPECPFTVTPEADTLDPHSFIDLLVTFDGSAVEACDTNIYQCNIIFHTNDPDESLVTVPVTMWCLRGDVSPNGVVNIADIVYLLNYIWINGPDPDPICLGDVNRDGVVDVLDVSYLASYLFEYGTPPEPPPAAPKGDQNIETKTIRPMK
jgi:uncharacterized membrane protein